MSTEFDPNNPKDKPDHKWGSYTPHSYSKNRGNWKTHKTLKDVRSAIDWTTPLTVYEQVDGKWVERGRFNRNPPVIGENCYVCGEPVSDHEKRWPAWSPDADFEKVLIHNWNPSCKRKLKPRKG